MVDTEQSGAQDKMAKFILAYEVIGVLHLLVNVLSI